MTDRSSFITEIPDNITVEKNTKKIMLVIDSRDRDYKKYPNPAEYSFTLKEDLLDVLSIELYQATFPNQPLLHDGNNKLYLQRHNEESPGKITIHPSISLHQQTPQQIGNYLSKTLSSTLGDNIKVHLDTTTGYSTIQSDLSNNNFHLSWYGGEVAFSEPDIDRVLVRNDDGTEFRDLDGQLVYVERDISPQKDSYLSQSIGPLLGFHPKTIIPFWWGILQFDNTIDDGWFMYRDNKEHTHETILPVDSWIIVNNSERSRGRITKIIDIESNRVRVQIDFGRRYTSSNPPEFDNIQFHSGYYKSNQPYQLNLDKYISLSIGGINRNHSNNKYIFL